MEQVDSNKLPGLSKQNNPPTMKFHTYRKRSGIRIGSNAIRKYKRVHWGRHGGSCEERKRYGQKMTNRKWRGKRVGWVVPIG